MKPDIAKCGGVAAALDLVRRPGGATAAEVRQLLDCHAAYSHQVLIVLMARHGCVRTKGNQRAWRYFSCTADLQAWLTHKLNVVVAHIVIARRPRPVKARAAPPMPPAQEPVITAQTKFTRYTPPPAKADRLNPLARAPEVPGWDNQGPVIREGAMDFKRHQFPASRAFEGDTP